MSDIALKLFSADGALVPVFDLLLTADGDLASDEGLETAVILSLFLDRRALSSDSLPDASGDRRGWWADALAEDNDQIGSRLWLLDRANLSQQTLVDAKAYVEEALAWLVSDRVARRVLVTVTKLSQNRMGIDVEVHRADGSRWQRLWQMALS